MEMTIEDVVRVEVDAFKPMHKPEPQKWLLCRSRAEDIKALCRADGRLHLLYAAPFVAAYAVSIATQLLVDVLWVNLVLSAVLGQLLYCLFVLHHDCMHGAGFKNDLYNRIMGRLYALSFTMTFTTNRETHVRHHSHIADPERDPDEYYFSGGLKDIWPRLWRYYEWYTRISLTKYGTRVRAVVLTEQIVNVLLWAAVHAYLISQDMGVKVLYIFWLPMAFVALVINPITRGYEHAPITLYPPGDPRRRDMSKNAITITNPVFGWLCANITFHVEHHAYPRCPFYNLPKLHRVFQQEGLRYLVAPYPLHRVWKGKNMLRGMTCNAPADFDPVLAETVPAETEPAAA